MSQEKVITAGLDVGTSGVKVAVFRVGADGHGELLSKTAERIRRRDTKTVVRKCYDDALVEAKIGEDDVAYVASTGEGAMVDFRRGHFYGMTTHARGATWLMPGVEGVLDIGSLHARAIKIDPRSKVLGYRMTSQCASGSGQFIENIARYLGVTIDEVGELSMQAKNPEKPSGICAVLAETDVINMVSRGISRPNIIRGIHLSMADRLVRLLRSARISGRIALTGGLAADAGLRSALEELVDKDKRVEATLETHDDAIYAGAIGAALWAGVRHLRLAQKEREAGASATAAPA